MHIGGEHLPLIKAFHPILERISASMQHLAQRRLDIARLSAVVLKADRGDLPAVQCAFHSDIADAACAVRAAFRVIFKEAQPVDAAAIRGDIILAEQLIAAADEEDKALFCHRLSDVFPACAQIVHQHHLFAVSAAAQKQQVVIPHVPLFTDAAGIDCDTDASLMAALGQHEHVAFVSIQVHDVVIHP